MNTNELIIEPACLHCAPGSAGHRSGHPHRACADRARAHVDRRGITPGRLCNVALGHPAQHPAMLCRVLSLLAACRTLRPTRSCSKPSLTCRSAERAVAMQAATQPGQFVCSVISASCTRQYVRVMLVTSDCRLHRVWRRAEVSPLSHAVQSTCPLSCLQRQRGPPVNRQVAGVQHCDSAYLPTILPCRQQNMSST